MTCTQAVTQAKSQNKTQNTPNNQTEKIIDHRNKLAKKDGSECQKNFGKRLLLYWRKKALTN